MLIHGDSLYMEAPNLFLQNCTILIIDDDPLVQRGIFSMLQATPAHFISAPSAEVGITLAKRKQPCLILLDWQMPKITGIEALQMLKNDEETKHIPVIMMTAVAKSSEHTYQALSMGADDFLTKPFDVHELTGRICAVLRLYNANKQIAQQNETLTKISEDKSKLLSILSHDLKSPLNTIEGLIYLIEKEFDQQVPSSEIQHYIKLIKNITTQERNMIDDILELNAFENKQIQEDYQSVELVNWLQQQLVHYQCNPKKITVEFHTHLKLLSISTIPTFLKRILDNLVSNALKYSESKTTIQIILKDSQHLLELSIKDQGQGFMPEEVDQVFQNFGKFSAKPTNGESSSGIGLYIVKSIVDRLGGSILLKSEYRKGSEFTVLLPKKQQITPQSLHRQA